MKLSPKPWPLVIVKLVDGFVAHAKASGVKGRVKVYEGDGAEGHFYSIVVQVHAGETVMTRAPRK